MKIKAEENPFHVKMENKPREYDVDPILPEEIKPEEMKMLDIFVKEVTVE